MKRPATELGRKCKFWMWAQLARGWKFETSVARSELVGKVNFQSLVHITCINWWTKRASEWDSERSRGMPCSAPVPPSNFGPGVHKTFEFYWKCTYSTHEVGASWGVWSLRALRWTWEAGNHGCIRLGQLGCRTRWQSGQLGTEGVDIVFIFE